MTVDGNLALYWTREGAPLQERLIIGSLYFFSALIFLILQLSVIFVSYLSFDFITDKMTI